MRSLSLVLTAAATCSAALHAQAPGASWSLTATNTNPPLRRENPGAASATHLYVFGGRSGNSGGSNLNDLWQFDGANWRQMTADGDPNSPSARFQAAVAWDSARSKLVVFGGNDGTGVAGDTWEWDPNTNTWSNVTPSSSPSARRFCSMAFDPATATMILFGGLDGSGTHLNDTWSFNGTAWTQLNPSGPQPSTRRQHHLVTRIDFGDILMFGGQDASLPASQKWRTDTWRWDGSQWTQIPTANTPNAQVANDATYDLIRQRIVMTGGNGTGGQPVGTTAEFDSRTNDWVNRPADPGINKTSRYFCGYIPAVGKTFKVSGQALNASTPPTPTYEYQTSALATFTSGSPGCTSSAGVPSLVSTSPWIGSTYTVQVTNTPAAATTLLAIGVGTTSLSLATIGIGAANCVLTVDPLLGVPAIPTNGTPAVSLSIPNDIALAGAILRHQAIVIEGATASLSDRGDATYGAL